MIFNYSNGKNNLVTNEIKTTQRPNALHYGRCMRKSWVRFLVGSIWDINVSKLVLVSSKQCYDFRRSDTHHHHHQSVYHSSLLDIGCRMHCLPMVFRRSSLHLTDGHPTTRLLSRGLQLRACLPHRLSVLSQTWPAHCHVCHLQYSEFPNERLENH